MHSESENKEGEKVEGGDGEAQKDGDKDSDDKGTGEQWVKTSGLAADGGDFDGECPQLG
jgi:hypothetical protein